MLSEDQKQVNRFILDFKDGKRYASAWASKVVARRLNGIDCHGLVLCPVPASSQDKTDQRYNYFMCDVCRRTGAADGLQHLHVVGTKHQLHTSGIVRNDDYKVVIDANYFTGKQVVVFDDIFTTGGSARRFARQLQAAGARVVGGIFLSETRLLGVA